MEPIELVPESKDDIQKAITLETANDNEIMSNIDAIFESLEDVNWPISQVFIRALAPKFSLIRDVLEEYLRDGHEGVKYTLLNMFFVSSEEIRMKWSSLKDVLLKIAETPSNYERATGSFEYANNILDCIGIEHHSEVSLADDYLPVNQNEFKRYIQSLLKFLDYPDRELQKIAAETLVKNIDKWKNKLHTILRGECTYNVNILSILRNLFVTYGNSGMLTEFEEDLKNLPSTQARQTVEIIIQKYSSPQNK